MTDRTANILRATAFMLAVLFFPLQVLAITAIAIFAVLATYTIFQE
jgi:hypothetical protein